MIRICLVMFTLLNTLFLGLALAEGDTKTIEDLLGKAQNVEIKAQAEATADIIVKPKQTKKTLDIGKTGLPLPRFVSLKRDKVNIRKGPNEKYDIAWTYTRKNLPIEIIAEYDNWRKIRDHLGGEGWVFKSLLSGTRYAVVEPWDKTKRFAIRAKPSENANIIAYFEAGLLARVKLCDGKWCQLNHKTYQGYIEQNLLWGVYEDEITK